MTQFNLQAWLDSVEATIYGNLGDRDDDGDLTCAMCVQRFFIESSEDAAEAERRACLDPLLALDLAFPYFEGVDLLEWNRRAWWEFDFDAAKASKDAEAVRERTQIYTTTATCPKCPTELYFPRTRADFHPRGYICPTCHPAELEEAQERMRAGELEAQSIEAGAHA